jgi:hypothetical protein
MMSVPDRIDPECGYIDDALWQFHTARYSVALFAEPEDLDPADSFCDERDIEFARGAYGERGWGCSGEPARWFCAVVTVYGPDGKLIGSDYLGGCSYESFREFYSAHRWQYSRRQRKWIEDPKSRAWRALQARRPRRANGLRMGGDYFPSMVRQAIADARTTLGMQRDGDVRAA